MAIIRIAASAALAVGALLTGASAAHPVSPAHLGITAGAVAKPAGVIGCCDDD
jgi:hypothetical protein